MITCITFDLDGTLVDTAREIAEAANRTLQALGLPRRDTSDVTQLIGHGTRELMMGLLKQAAESAQGEARQHIERLDREAVMHCFEQHYGDTTGTDSQLYPGVATTLQRMPDGSPCPANPCDGFGTIESAAAGQITFQRRFSL